jgi:glyceraldehyde-3-phosphate dehydrogenase (NADP+)
VLHKAAWLLNERAEDFSHTLAEEVGKTIAEARGETARAIQTLTLSSEEAKRLTGDEVRFDGAPTGGGKIGFYRRVPLGVVVAITPFNFPLNLGMHKVAPALAAGNSVVLKPATVTPLSSLMLGELFWEVGVPPKAFNVVTGPGGEVGDTLVQHPKVKMVTFTGSRDVGKAIMTKAGFKKTTMELGSNSAVVVCEDADLDAAAGRCCGGTYALAGQVCISVQRIFVQRKVFDTFVERFVERVKVLKVGDQLSEETNMGPMITVQEAQRVLEWIDDAVKIGAKLVIGGEIDGAMLSPSVVNGC